MSEPSFLPGSPNADSTSLWIVLYAPRGIAGVPSNVYEGNRKWRVEQEGFNWAFVIASEKQLEERTGTRFCIWQERAKLPEQFWWAWFLEVKTECRDNYEDDVKTSGDAIGPPLARFRIAEVKDAGSVRDLLASEKSYKKWISFWTGKEWVEEKFLDLMSGERAGLGRKTSRDWNSVQTLCEKVAEEEAAKRIQRDEKGRITRCKWKGERPLLDLIDMRDMNHPGMGIADILEDVVKQMLRSSLSDS